MPAEISALPMAMARNACRSCRLRGSWLPSISARIDSNALPGRETTPSTMACDTRKCEVNGSGCAATSFVEGGLRPADEALRWLAAHHLSLLGSVVAGLGNGPFVLDDVFRGEDDDVTGDVEARPAGPAGDLVELPGGQDPGAVAVVLGQRRHQHRPDRHVDTHPEGVGSADHLQQAGLGELFDKPPVLGQHAGVMHPDAVPDQPGQRAAEPRREPEIGDHLGDLVPLCPAGDRQAGQCLRPLQGGGLGEVHDVHRRPVGGQQILQASR